MKTKNIQVGKCIILLTLLLASVSLQTVTAAPSNPYKLKLQFPSLGAYKIDVDGAGNIYVVGRNSLTITKYDDKGTFIKSWGGPGTTDGKFEQIEGIAVDYHNGIVYVTETYRDTVQKFDLNGVYIGKWGNSGSDTGQLCNPMGLDVDSSGNVYVTDLDNNRVEWFTPEGTYIGKVGGAGNGNGEFNNPESIAVDSLGNFYVGDVSNNRIQKFDHEGHFLSILGSYGNSEGQFNGPKDVGIDSKNNVYVVDAGNSRIQAFDPSGHLTAVWGSRGNTDGSFNDPNGVAVDDMGNVYVADTGNSRVQIFAPTTGNLVITLRDQNGAPLVGVDVASTAQPEGQEPLHGTTNSDGTVTFTGVTAGTYTVQGMRNGQLIGTLSAEVTAGSTTSPTITQSALGNVIITVRDHQSNLVEGATVKMKIGPTGQGALSGSTGTDGKAHFTGVKPGSYQFNASKSGYMTSLSNVFTVSAGGDSEALIYLSNPPTPTAIVFKVTESNGSPIVGADVLVTPTAAGARAYSGRTNASGASVFYPELGGDHTVKVSKAGYETITMSTYITLEQTRVFNLVLRPLASVKVTVVDTSTSLPLAGASVSSTLQPAGESPKTSDSNGKASFGDVNPGSYTVKVTLTGYTDVTTGIFIVDYGDVKELTVQMGRPEAPTVLRVLTVDKQGSPVYAVSLYLDSTPTQPQLTGSTTTQGIFEFSGIQPGSYKLRLEKLGWEMLLANGQTGYAKVDVQVDPGVTTEVKVVLIKPDMGIPGFPIEAMILGLAITLLILTKHGRGEKLSKRIRINPVF